MDFSTAPPLPGSVEIQNFQRSTLSTNKFGDPQCSRHRPCRRGTRSCSPGSWRPAGDVQMARRRRGRGQNNVEKRAARPSPHIRSKQERVPPVLMQLRPRPLDLHGRMTALSKPNGSVRVMVVGDVIRRLCKVVEAATSPFQCALSTRAGCDAWHTLSGHCARSILGPPLCQWTESVHVMWFRGEQCWKVSIRCGGAEALPFVRTRDPLMHLLLALGQHGALEAVQRTHGGHEQLLAFFFIFSSESGCDGQSAAAFIHARIRLQVQDANGVVPESGLRHAMPFSELPVWWTLEPRKGPCWEHHWASPSLS